MGEGSISFSMIILSPIFLFVYGLSKELCALASLREAKGVRSLESPLEDSRKDAKAQRKEGREHGIRITPTDKQSLNRFMTRSHPIAIDASIKNSNCKSNSDKKIGDRKIVYTFEFRRTPESAKHRRLLIGRIRRPQFEIISFAVPIPFDGRRLDQLLDDLSVTNLSVCLRFE